MVDSSCPIASSMPTGHSKYANVTLLFWNFYEDTNALPPVVRAMSIKVLSLAREDTYCRAGTVLSKTKVPPLLMLSNA